MPTIPYPKLKPELELLERFAGRLASKAYELAERLPDLEETSRGGAHGAQSLLRDELEDTIGRLNTLRGSLALVADRERKAYQAWLIGQVEETAAYLESQGAKLEGALDDVDPKAQAVGDVYTVHDAARAVIEPLQTELAVEIDNLNRFLELPETASALVEHGLGVTAWRPLLESSRQLVHRAVRVLARKAPDPDSAHKGKADATPPPEEPAQPYGPGRDEARGRLEPEEPAHLNQLPHRMPEGGA